MRLAAAAVAPGNHTGVCACVTDPGSPYTNLATENPHPKNEDQGREEEPNSKRRSWIEGVSMLTVQRKNGLGGQFFYAPHCGHAQEANVDKEDRSVGCVGVCVYHRPQPVEVGRGVIVMVNKKRTHCCCGVQGQYGG